MNSENTTSSLQRFALNVGNFFLVLAAVGFVGSFILAIVFPQMIYAEFVWFIIGPCALFVACIGWIFKDFGKTNAKIKFLVSITILLGFSLYIVYSVFSYLNSYLNF